MKGTKIRTSKKEGRESKNQGTAGRCMTGNSRVPGERESARKRKMKARFRCENEERESRYWTEGEERRCRMCCEERDN
jgi:hypothetical protein